MITTPTTQDIAAAIVAQMELSISQTVPLLPKTFVRVLAKVLAAVVVILYKYAGWIFLQMFVAYATMEEVTINGVKTSPLIEWGRLIGVGDPDAATAAEISIEIIVVEQGDTLDAGQPLVRVSTGVVYQTIAAVDLDAPTKTVTMRAVADAQGGTGAGTIGNLEAGDIVEFANPLGNVAREATVLSAVVTGADGDTVEEYRAKIIRKFQEPPQGGAYADYREWGEEVAGVSHVYPYTGAPGEVDIYVEADSDIDPDGIPTLALLGDVFDSIQVEVSGLATRRPVNDAVNALPITRTAFDVTISGLSVSDEVGCKDSIDEAVDEYLRSREPFIVGLSVLPRDDRVTRASIGGLVDGVVEAFGGTVVDVTLSQGAVALTAFTLANGEKAKLGTISYV